MRMLSNTEAELKKSAAYEKSVYMCNITEKTLSYCAENLSYTMFSQQKYEYIVPYFHESLITFRSENN